MNKNVQTFIGCEAEYDAADIVLLGVPFDGTASFRPGSRFAGGAIRAESFGIETYSPYQNKDLTDIRVFDGGDLELPFGNAGAVIERVRHTCAEIINDGKIPFLIGGEHLITLGGVQAAYNAFPDLHIIHFDAHADLRSDYLGEALSHATVIRRCHDIVGDGKISQFGIRSGDREELEWGRGHVNTNMFSFEGLGETVKALGKKPVYLTIDLDVLDPSVFPGTGTPEAGGVSFDGLLRACLMCGGLNIAGIDVCELSPPYDASGVSTAVACKLIRELLLML